MENRSTTLGGLIKRSIKEAGGRIALGHAIIKENPGIFTEETTKYFNGRYNWQETKRKKVGIKKRKGNWSEEDTDYISMHYTKKRTSSLVKILNRSAPAIRQKYYYEYRKRENTRKSFKKNS